MKARFAPASMLSLTILPDYGGVDRKWWGRKRWGGEGRYSVGTANAFILLGLVLVRRSEEGEANAPTIEINHSAPNTGQVTAMTTDFPVNRRAELTYDFTVRSCDARERRVYCRI